MEAWSNLGILLFCALLRPQLSQKVYSRFNNQMGIFLNFELIWVCPIQDGKIVSFPYYQRIQSPQDYHEIKTVSVPYVLHREAQVLLISYWSHAHIWNRSTKGKEKMKAWPLISSLSSSFLYFNLSSILTFRILRVFLKREEGIQRKHFCCLLM